MIPKIIHYCWFGGSPLPDIAQKCIASWKKHSPDYEFMLWNETNFDINIVPFTAQVAKVKKWGFIVDYIRAYVIYNYGGIYLDTDVELLRPFDGDILQNTCFSGFESEVFVNPGNIFAGEKGCSIAKELMDFYASYNFVKEDGELNLTPSPKIFTDILLKYGLKQNNTYQKFGTFTIYPTEYFCPMPFETGILNESHNTYSIHHFEASWFSDKDRLYNKFRRRIFSIFGENIFSKNIVIIIYVFKRIKENGLVNTIKYYHTKYWKKI